MLSPYSDELIKAQGALVVEDSRRNHASIVHPFVSKGKHKMPIYQD